MLLPPLLPTPPPQFQTVSETYEPAAPVVVRVVAPTCVMLGLSDGKEIEVVNASESPVALKNDCPWVAICLKMVSEVASGPPPPHEQLSCLARLSLAILLSMLDHDAPLGAS